MTKSPRTGGEIDSYCTKCKLVLGHRIIAMVGTKPVRVECRTCGSHHNFRPRAPGEREERAAAGARPRSSAGAAPRTGTTRVTKAQEAERDRARTWEAAVLGKALAEFKPYKVSTIFSEGDIIRHGKFGEGVVTRIIDAHKIEILFKDDVRTLAQGLSD